MKNLELLDRVCDRYWKELEDQFHKMEKTSQVSASDLEIMDTIVHTIKGLETVNSMLNRNNDKYSGTSIRIPDPTYRYSGRGDSMRRYSGHDEKSDIIRKLEDMMHNVRTEDDALAIQDAINAVDRVR